MNHPTNTIPILRSALAVAFALALWAPVLTRAAESADGKMMEHCEAMKAQKQKLMADVKEQDSELATRVAKMNSAAENEKLAMVAAVVTHLVEQQTAMNARKAKMEEAMMKHMMQHMEMGKESMAHCPMMKGMKAMDEKSEGAHKEHHADPK